VRKGSRVGSVEFHRHETVRSHARMTSLLGLKAQVHQVPVCQPSWSRRSSCGSHDEVEHWQSAPLVRQSRLPDKEPVAWTKFASSVYILAVETRAKQAIVYYRTSCGLLVATAIPATPAVEMIGWALEKSYAPSSIPSESSGKGLHESSATASRQREDGTFSSLPTRGGTHVGRAWRPPSLSRRRTRPRCGRDIFIHSSMPGSCRRITYGRSIATSEIFNSDAQYEHSSRCGRSGSVRRWGAEGGTEVPGKTPGVLRRPTGAFSCFLLVSSGVEISPSIQATRQRDNRGLLCRSARSSSLDVSSHSQPPKQIQPHKCRSTQSSQIALFALSFSSLFLSSSDLTRSLLFCSCTFIA